MVLADEVLEPLEERLPRLSETLSQLKSCSRRTGGVGINPEPVSTTDARGGRRKTERRSSPARRAVPSRSPKDATYKSPVQKVDDGRKK